MTIDKNCEFYKNFGALDFSGALKPWKTIFNVNEELFCYVDEELFCYVDKELFCYVDKGQVI